MSTFFLILTLLKTDEFKVYSINFSFLLDLKLRLTLSWVLMMKIKLRVNSQWQSNRLLSRQWSGRWFLLSLLEITY
jgi:hypothetical protein